MRDVIEAVHVWGRLHPKRPAVVLHDRLITYGMLLSGILSVEQKIASLRMDRERLVAVCIDSPARHIIVTLALAKAGYSMISLGPNNFPAPPSLNVGAVLADQRGNFGTLLPTLVTDDWFSQSVSLNEWQIAPFDSNRLRRVALTSGATGLGKPIGHSQAAMTLRIGDLQRRLLTAHARVLIVFGLNSNVGMIGSLAILGQGQTALFAPSIEDCMHMIPAASVDCIFASIQQVSEMVRFERQRGTGGSCDTVRSIVSGGAYLSPALLDDIQALFPCDFYQCYASTEAGPAGIANVAMLRRPGGTNRYVQSARIRIEDIDTGDATGVGRIAVHSDHMGQAFDGNLTPGQPDEWFYPGDLGYIDEAGYLVVVGRADDLINMGGVKRSAEFVEDHFVRSALISDCAVTRLDTPSGPKIVLLVTPNGAFDESAIREWGSRHSLRFVVDHVFATSGIPRGGMMKIERGQVRNIAQRLLADRNKSLQ